MVYRKIDSATKIQAVTRVLGGESIASASGDLGVDRDSLSLWLRKTMNALNKIFEKARTAPPHARRDRNERVRNLRENAAAHRKAFALLKEEMRKLARGPIPDTCPRCGCEKWYRNGFVYARLGSLLGSRVPVRNEMKIPVQRFCCAQCAYSEHLRGPRAFYHWVAKEINHKTDNMPRLMDDEIMPKTPSPPKKSASVCRNP